MEFGISNDIHSLPEKLTWAGAQGSGSNVVDAFYSLSNLFNFWLTHSWSTPWSGKFFFKNAIHEPFWFTFNYICVIL
jgi:hypothetical protein